MDHKGERVTMSTKVGEMNKVIPMHLGVPPAILENVIFCHQDESLWPMSEPTKLKAKFDEIFEAQKYTKAIDAIKSMGKQHNIKLGQLVIHENNFKNLKDRAERVQKQSEALQAEIEEIREKITTVEEKIVEATEDRKEKHKRAIQALGIVDELKTKTQRAQYLEATLSDLRENFEERHESDQELQSILEQFEETMAEYSRQLAEHKDRYQELQDSADDCQRRMSAKQAERGQHQAEKESYERQLESRVQVVKNAARDHSIRGYEGDIDEDQIKDFVARIQKEARDRDLDLERITTESNEELRKTQNALSELESQRVTRTEKRLAAQQAITANNKREDLKMKEQASINIEVGTMAALNADVIAIKDRLEQARSSFRKCLMELQNHRRGQSSCRVGVRVK